jgi:hypothetical protein
MLDLLSPRMQRRLLILSDYIQALSQGDLETTNKVLAAAEHDEVLARMILEVNALSQEDQQMELQPAEQAMIGRLLADDLLVLQEIGSLSQPATNRPRSGNTRRSLPGGTKRGSKRVRAFLGSLAAVLLVGVLVGSFLLVLTQSHHPGTKTTSSHGSSTSPSWRTLPLPTVVGGGNLKALTALSQNNAWAVGEKLILHWNGQQWQPVTGLSISDFTLSSIAATAANDVWVVGSYKDSSAPGKGIKPLLAHWDGHQWRLVTSGDLPTLGELYSVAALSSSDVWATGDSFSSQDDSSQSLILHWDGQQWSVVSHPERAGTFNTSLNAITALSANDVWAVGYDSYNHPSQYQANVNETLVEHWDGTSWKVVPSPSTGLNDDLTSVTAISANDIWAVGSTDQGMSNSSTNAGAPIAPEGQIEHWDGKSWNIVRQAQSSGPLSEIAAISTNDIWAVGALADAHDVVTSELEHWDGQHWSSVSFPNHSNSALSLVAPIPGTNEVWLAWANSEEILIGPE